VGGGVFEMLNSEPPREVTFEEIGRLVAFAHDLEESAERLRKRAATIKEAAAEDLARIARDPSYNDLPRFDRFGTRV
jgi:hypothetical protein